MADLKDLGITSILDMGQDESLERLRQIRLSRRIPVKTKGRKTTAAKKAQAKAIPKLSSEQAANLLNLIEGEDV